MELPLWETCLCQDEFCQRGHFRVRGRGIVVVWLRARMVKLDCIAEDQIRDCETEGE